MQFGVETQSHGVKKPIITCVPCDASVVLRYRQQDGEYCWGRAINRVIKFAQG